MTRLLLALPLLALAACGNEPEVKMENVSVGEAASEMRRQTGGAGFVKPGKWEQRVSLLEIEAPGMPEQVRSSMKQAMAGQTQVHEVCLTPEQAQNPSAECVGAADKHCRSEHFNWGVGTIDLKLDC